MSPGMAANLKPMPAPSMTKACHSKVRKRGEKGAGRADDERADGKQAALADRLAPLAADLDQPDQVPERTCGESRIRAGAVALIRCCPSSCGLIDCLVIDACQRVLEASRKRGAIQFAAVPSGDGLAGGIAQDVIE